MKARSIQDEALDWLVRSRASDFQDWAGLQDWLQRAQAHGEAFDAELARAERLDGLTPALRTLVAPAPSHPRLAANGWLGWTVGGVVSAGLASALLVLAGVGPHRTVVTTGTGQDRTISLSGGGSIALGPQARIDLVPSPSGVKVIVGRGDLRLQAPASAPLTVVAGDDMLRVADASAVVHRGGGRLKIGVADGLVYVGPASGRRGPRVTLPPGSRLDHVEGTTVFDVHEPGAADLVIR